MGAGMGLCVDISSGQCYIRGDGRGWILKSTSQHIPSRAGLSASAVTFTYSARELKGSPVTTCTGRGGGASQRCVRSVTCDHMTASQRAKPSQRLCLSVFDGVISAFVKWDNWAVSCSPLITSVDVKDMRNSQYERKRMRGNGSCKCEK